ncbi:MAG TPA: diacylglycerol kinase family protein [Kofleriaceae bacterium]|nr:diacylglycerol kinase family protein [Kofleriaceae bacterium]
MTRPRRVAVMLNPRAQGVTSARLAWFRAHVAAGDLFVPDSVARAAEVVRDVAARGYEVLCTGGGDGTFMLAAAALCELAPAAMPALMPLRLGTGNAVHDVCGSSRPTRRGLAHDLARAADPREPAAPLRLLEVDGRLTQFAGVGLDADWAADYAWLIKRHVGTGPLLPLVRGAPGYALTALGLTIPRLVRRPFVQMKLIARGGASRLDAEGRSVGELADGEVLYEGPATMASMSTVASYSAGFAYFRHVDRIGDAFEVKVAIASAYQVVRHARRVLGGGHDPARVLDFAARGLTVELPVATRYHVGGDVLPPAAAFSARTSRHAVPVLRRR